MATLNIKGVPDPIYRKLEARAKRERRSVAQEVIHILSKAVEEPPPLSIMDLEGLGKETWQGIDAAKYVEEERSSWDGWRTSCPVPSRSTPRRSSTSSSARRGSSRS